MVNTMQQKNKAHYLKFTFVVGLCTILISFLTINGCDEEGNLTAISYEQGNVVYSALLTSTPPLEVLTKRRLSNITSRQTLQLVRVSPDTKFTVLLFYSTRLPVRFLIHDIKLFNIFILKKGHASD